MAKFGTPRREHSCFAIQKGGSNENRLGRRSRRRVRSDGRSAFAQTIELGPRGPSIDLRSRGERERDFRREQYRRDREAERRYYRRERYRDEGYGDRYERREYRRGYGY